MTLRSTYLSALLLAVGLSASTFAAHHAKKGGSLFTETFLKTYTAETDKLVSLAEAFSEEGFEWRPAEGIRSVREAVLHVAGANYFIGSRLGKEMPDGLNPRKFEEMYQSKDEAVAALKKSVAFVKSAVGSLDDEALAEPVKMFGQDFNKMGAALVVGGHAYEHLGQLIAYARSFGVVPPWSQ